MLYTIYPLTANLLKVLATQVQEPPSAPLKRPRTVDISNSPPVPPTKKTRSRGNRASAQTPSAIPVIPLNGSVAAPLASMIEWRKELFFSRSDKLAAEADLEAAIQAAKAKAKVRIEEAERRESVATERYLELLGILATETGRLPAPPVPSAPSAGPVAGPSRLPAPPAPSATSVGPVAEPSAPSARRVARQSTTGKGKGKQRAEPSDDEEAGMAEEDLEDEEMSMDTR